MKKLPFLAILLLMTLIYKAQDQKNLVGTDDPEYVPFKKKEAEESYINGNQLTRKKMYKAAEVAYKKSLQLEPDQPVALLNLGNLYKEVDKPKEAEECYLKIIKMKPEHSVVYSNMSAIKLNAGDYPSTIKYAKIGLAKAKSDHVRQLCSFNMSAAYSNIDSCQQAKKYFYVVKKFVGSKLEGMYSEYDQYLKKRCP